MNPKGCGHLAPTGCGLRPIAYDSGHGFCGTHGLFAGQRAVLTLEDGRKVAVELTSVDEEIGHVHFVVHSAASTC
jgi:hypothetical protein